MQNRLLAFLGGVLCFFSEAVVKAETVTYTFESPVFSLGQTTPLLNKVPNLGSASFLASFTASPAAGGLAIGNNPNLPSGLSLSDPGSLLTPDGLTITVNTPITGVQLDFALFLPGHLDFTSASGNMAALTGPASQVGSLIFSSASPFTQFTLTGFSEANNPVLLAIDNLVMTVPEPSLVALFSIGLLAGHWSRIRRANFP